MARLGYVGLGIMGGPMARHLATAQHSMTVFNRTTTKADAWVGQHGGARVLTPREVALASDIVLMCVGNDDDVRSVVFGADGILAGLKTGGILVDHTTASATIAREIADACAKQGCGFVDAPVSGGQAGAENGQLTIMCGSNDSATFDAIEPIIAAYAKRSKLLGTAGSGQLAKMVNQICIAGIAQGLSEALNFAMRAGLNPDDVVDVISKGAAQSWQMENRAKTMVRNEFEFGFAVEWMRKDLGICFDEASRNGAQLPMTEMVDKFYAEVVAMGGKRWDTSSLIARLTD
ncbi:MAG: NAD(P)-dependent oxidoreductase [Actinobacteria bacterium]|nr:MAG: NAD(P)-dependent oxidoreductase [Actinomycetota bacterium]